MQTDETLYAKLARHMATTGSPPPHAPRRARSGFLSVAYPSVVVLFYGGLDNVAAFNAAHAVNAVLFASAAIPLYLLGMRLVTPGWVLVARALGETTP